MDQKPKIQVLIRRKDKIFFEGVVNAISSVNEVGPFDILPFHANFVCTVNQYVRIHLDNNLTRDYEIPKGVLYVKDNRVEVYVGV